MAASWGEGPGKAEQWDLLTRARALDSTSWVLACGQARPSRPSGDAPTGIGRSRVVDPLGVVVAELGEEPGRLVVDLTWTGCGRSAGRCPSCATAGSDVPSAAPGP